MGTRGLSSSVNTSVHCVYRSILHFNTVCTAVYSTAHFVFLFQSICISVSSFTVAAVKGEPERQVAGERAMELARKVAEQCLCSLSDLPY